MQHWLVIDLEATTEDGGWPVAEMEIIEIGASLVTRDGHEVAELRPLRPRPLDAATLLGRWRRLPLVDPIRFRDDIDAVLDASL